MYQTPKSINKLKKIAIPLPEGAKVHCPLPPNYSTITLSKVAFSSAYRKSYTITNKVVTFLDEDLNWFIIPELKGIKELLKKNNYKLVDIYVPCSDNYSYPVDHKEEWEALIAQR